jgi:hypothetical protein
MPTLRIAACCAAFLTAAPVMAQTCENNFQVEGVALLTALNFRTSQTFSGVNAGKALNSLRSAMLAEGFSNIDVDRSGGALTAFQETTGSGRPQTLRVTARKAGNGTRVDAVFSVQAGQVADAGTVRAAMCRVFAGARL